MADWLGRRPGNPEVANSSPTLTTKLELSLGRHQFNSSVMLVTSNWSTSCQLGFLCLLSLFEIFVSFSLSAIPKN